MESVEHIASGHRLRTEPLWIEPMPSGTPCILGMRLSKQESGDGLVMVLTDTNHFPRCSFLVLEAGVSGCVVPSCSEGLDELGILVLQHTSTYFNILQHTSTIQHRPSSPEIVTAESGRIHGWPYFWPMSSSIAVHIRMT